MAWTIAALLFALNAWICHRLFTTEFLGFQSNEAAFISLGRIYRDHWRDLAWFPFFDCGMPIEDAYQPFLPALTALVSGLTALSIGGAFHLVMALAYCLGPVTLFWLVWEWSESLAASCLAGSFYSLISPAAMFFPAVRAVSGGPWVPQRLFNIVFYGEDPHNVALTLLPVALVFLRRLVVRRDRWSFIGAVISCGAVVITNAFGAMSVTLGALCTVLALQSGFGIVALAGVVAWCWISPWISPTLLATIQSIALTQRGQYQGGPQAETAVAFVAALFLLMWVFTRRLKSSFERFVCLFLPWMCAFPVAFYVAGITLVPQPHRYQLELELAICLALAAICARAPLGAAAFVMGALLVHQIPAYRNFAQTLIRPVEITKTAEYRLAKWIDTNLPRERVMVSGDAAWLFNVFSDHPQMSGGHDASTPNFMQQVAVYQLYTGMNAGERDAEISLFWLKAFGAHAVTMPAANSAEVYKPYVNAAKFQNVLPVLWRDGPDVVYEVPLRSASLAHVIPAAAIVTRQPVHGLDLDPARAYVAALDDPAMPQPDLRWDDLSKGTLHAVISADQVISLQMNFDKHWHASVRGRPVPVRKDGLGLMIVEPHCSGSCNIDLEFGPTTETWLCRVLSAVASLALLVLLLIRPAGRSGGAAPPAWHRWLHRVG